MPKFLAQQLIRPQLYPLFQPDLSAGSQVTQGLVQTLQEGSINSSFLAFGPNKKQQIISCLFQPSERKAKKLLL